MMRSGIIPATNQNVRRIRLLGFMIMIIGLSGSNVFALDMMGPPAAELEKGMFRGGLEYSFSSMDIELIEGQAIVYRNGLSLGSGTVQSVTINDFEVNTLYATLGYGVFENCEAFLRMGAANATFGDALWEEGEDLESNIDLAIGAGIKATLYEGFNWKIGGLIQINRTELDGDLDSSSWGIPQPNLIDISTTEMQIALGVTYLKSGRLSIYGGPFAHFISGDFDYKFNRIFDENFDTGKFSWEINEGPIYGGYLGAQVKIIENCYGNIEYQFTSDANVFGLSVMLKY